MVGSSLTTFSRWGHGAGQTKMETAWETQSVRGTSDELLQGPKGPNGADWQHRTRPARAPVICQHRPLRRQQRQAGAGHLQHPHRLAFGDHPCGACSADSTLCTIKQPDNRAAPQVKCMRLHDYYAVHAQIPRTRTLKHISQPKETWRAEIYRLHDQRPPIRTSKLRPNKNNVKHDTDG